MIFSINIGALGEITNNFIDVGYNLFNTDHAVWSIGGRFRLTTFVIGVSTNFDVLIPMTDKSSFNFGTGIGLCLYPGDNFMDFEWTPRVGIAIKVGGDE